MNSVNFLEKLLGGVEVEWNELGKIGEFVRGKRFVKTDIVSEGTPCIHYGEIYTYFGISAKRTKSFLCEDLASKLRFAQPGDVVIVSAGETIEDIGNATAWIGAEDIVIHDACFAFKSKLNPVYVSYFLRTKYFKDQIKKSISSGKISSINSSGLGKALIPIPCPGNPRKSLEIQAEIVCILDAMTARSAELTTELAAELAARKKQYNYYRDKLLSFKDREVEWTQLGEEFPFIRNGFVGTVTPFFTTPDKGVRYLQGTNIKHGIIRDNVEYYINLDFHEKHSRTHLKADDILMVQSGHVGDSAVVGEKYKDSNCHALIVISNAGRMNSKFVNYYFQSKEGKEKLKRITTGGTVKHILASKMKKFMIPVPSIEEQNRIVAVLDKFNALTTSITNGLPREIELRQKQYAYYRDLLLSFPQTQAA